MPTSKTETPTMKEFAEMIGYKIEGDDKWLLMPDGTWLGPEAATECEMRLWSEAIKRLVPPVTPPETRALVEQRARLFLADRKLSMYRANLLADFHLSRQSAPPRSGVYRDESKQSLVAIRATVEGECAFGAPEAIKEKWVVDAILRLSRQSEEAGLLREIADRSSVVIPHKTGCGFYEAANGKCSCGADALNQRLAAYRSRGGKS